MVTPERVRKREVWFCRCDKRRATKEIEKKKKKRKASPGGFEENAVTQGDRDGLEKTPLREPNKGGDPS